MQRLLIIDPFIRQPVNNCFNRLVDLLPAKLYLYQPAFFPSTHYHWPAVDGYIVLGSASHVFEKLPWQTELSNFLLEELHKNKPVLGLCFGHQLLAHAFGAEVDFLKPEQHKVTGYRTLNWNNIDYTLGVTHRQSVKKLSPELISLSSSEETGFDLICHKSLPFLGCQAHPEASDQFLANDCEVKDENKRKKILKSSTDFFQTWLKNSPL